MYDVEKHFRTTPIQPERNMLENPILHGRSLGGLDFGPFRRFLNFALEAEIRAHFGFFFL